MIQELKLPELGEGIDDVTVTNILVAAGDQVDKDQPVLEVETEKASLEVPSPFAGTVKEVMVQTGRKISVGSTVLTVDSSATAAAAAPPAPSSPETASDPAPAAAPPPPVAATPPAASQQLAEVVEFERSSPVIREPTRGEPTLGDPAPAAPSVRRLARELGVEIRRVPGSGPAGRISRDDVKAFVKQQMQSGVPAAAPGVATVQELPDLSRFGPIEREQLSSLRMAAASRLTATWNAAPHVTQHDRADITELDAARRGFAKRAAKVGAKLTVTAIALKVVASALKVFPQFNASLDLANGEVVKKKFIHVGVAVDTDRGLLVPVIRDADIKNVTDLAIETAELAARARDRKLTPDEMTGSCITVSNLGGLGTTYFTPILNWPDVAILGLGRAEMQAVHRDGAFEPRLILPLSLSYDHRWIDGADAARFLRWIAEALEQPILIALEG